MNRLFYEDRKNRAKYRSDNNKIEYYSEKIVKLIPSEIVGLYLTLVGIVSSVDNTNKILATLIVFLICWLLTPLYFYKVADKSKPYKNHLIISSFAFVVWAYATSGPLIQDIYIPWVASVTLVIFSFTSSLVTLNH